MNMSTWLLRLCSWCGPGLMALLFVGLVFAHWFPPPSPADSVTAIAQQYQQHTTGIRVGALLIAAAGTMFGPFSAAIAVQLKRIHAHATVFAYLEVCMGALWSIGIVVPASFWMVAAFDPYRDPQITRALHVAGWLPFVAMVFPLMAAHLSIAAATLLDTRSEPVFPRWITYLNVWIALLLAPGVLTLFFKTGPFSWNGILTFWLAATAEGLWFCVMSMVLHRAINQQIAEEAIP